MKLWRRSNDTSRSSGFISSDDEEEDEGSTSFVTGPEPVPDDPTMPDPVIGKEDKNGDEEDANTMDILTEGARETLCPERGVPNEQRRSINNKNNAQHTTARVVSFQDEEEEHEAVPESSKWFPDCCSKSDTADGVASLFSTPSWFSGTAEDKVVEQKAAVFAASVDEVSREANMGLSDRAIADLESVSDDASTEVRAEDLANEATAGHTDERVVSRTPSPERKARVQRLGIGALMAGMFPKSRMRGTSTQWRDVGAKSDEASPKKVTKEIVGVDNELVDDSMSYADKDDNTPNGTVGLIPLATHDVSDDDDDPETGVKQTDRDSATENASDIAEGGATKAIATAGHGGGRRRRWCLGLFLMLLIGVAATVLGILRPWKSGEIGSSTSQSVETNSTDVEPADVSNSTTVIDQVPKTEGEPIEDPVDEEPTEDVDDKEQPSDVVIPPVDTEESTADTDESTGDKEETNLIDVVPPLDTEESTVDKEETNLIDVVPPLDTEESTGDKEETVDVVPPLDEPPVDEEPPRESFAILADAPFDDDSMAALEEQLPSLDAEFIVHLGNIRSESSDCQSEDYARAAQALLTSSTPVFLVPGPNDWSVCDDPDSALASYTEYFTDFTETNWDVARVRRHPRNPGTFRYRYDGNTLILGVDLVETASIPIENKIQETIAWSETALANFNGTSVVVVGYSTPIEFMERIDGLVPLGVSIRYLNGGDATALPALVDL